MYHYHIGEIMAAVVVGGFLIFCFLVTPALLYTQRKDKRSSAAIPRMITAYHDEIKPFANDIRRTFTAGGIVYAMYVEQEYRKVRLPEDRDGYTNYTFAAMMIWFAIPIVSSPRMYSKYNISRNLYALLDFNIAMYVAFDVYMFGDGDPFNLRESWRELYYTFLSQYCHKEFHLELEAVATLFDNRLEHYRCNKCTIDDIDIPLVEFIIRDINGTPFASSTPVVDCEEKAKLFSTVTASLANADELAKAILEQAAQF